MALHKIITDRCPGITILTPGSGHVVVEDMFFSASDRSLVDQTLEGIEIVKSEVDGTIDYKFGDFSD